MRDANDKHNEHMHEILKCMAQLNSAVQNLCASFQQPTSSVQHSNPEYICSYTTLHAPFQNCYCKNSYAKEIMPSLKSRDL